MEHRVGSPTDIESFVDAPGRKELVAEVRKKIDELGIEYLYLQFVSVTGRIMGKGIPADHWESVARKGFQLVYGATMNLFLNRRGDYLGYGPEAAELIGIPEPETFMQLPWDKRVARLWCTLFRNREERVEPGAFLTADARGNLRRIHEQFQKEHGLQLRHGTEPEMMWLKKDESGQPNGGYSNPYCYHIDQFESLRPVYMRVIEYCRKMGLDMIQGDHEDSPGQLELNFTFDDALRTADRLATYRQICAQVAREFNIIACFMPKPFMGVSASGCHHNLSLWTGGTEKLNDLGHGESLPGMEGRAASMRFHFQSPALLLSAFIIAFLVPQRPVCRSPLSRRGSPGRSGSTWLSRNGISSPGHAAELCGERALRQPATISRWPVTRKRCSRATASRRRSSSSLWNSMS